MKILKNGMIACTLILSLLWGIQPAVAEPTVVIGVLAKRGAEKAIEQWGPTAEYLSDRLKTKVQILPMKFTEIEPALKNRKIDFLLANSAFYARFEEKYALKAIVTMSNRKSIAALDRFGGVIFARSNSNINDLDSIRGKKIHVCKIQLLRRSANGLATAFGKRHRSQKRLQGISRGWNP